MPFLEDNIFKSILGSIAFYEEQVSGKKNSFSYFAPQILVPDVYQGIH